MYFQDLPTDSKVGKRSQIFRMRIVSSACHQDNQERGLDFFLKVLKDFYKHSHCVPVHCELPKLKALTLASINLCWFQCNSDTMGPTPHRDYSKKYPWCRWNWTNYRSKVRECHIRERDIETWSEFDMKNWYYFPSIATYVSRYDPCFCLYINFIPWYT